MTRETVTMTVSVQLDPVPGVFHTPESARAIVEGILIDAIGHYLPVVALEEQPPRPTDDLVCPLCGQAIQDGDRRVSWFSKTGGEVDERGASHLVCPDTIPYATEEGVVVAVDLDGTVHRQKPVRPPWIDPRGCFGHCDPEGWHVPCADPALANRS